MFIYLYYITILDMFRAILCSSSGGQNCIVTASGIVTRPYSAPVESGLQYLDAEISDHLDIALLLKTKRRKTKTKNKQLLYAKHFSLHICTT
jgi:hypothetical protein